MATQGFSILRVRREVLSESIWHSLIAAPKYTQLSGGSKPVKNLACPLPWFLCPFTRAVTEPHVLATEAAATEAAQNIAEVIGAHFIEDTMTNKCHPNAAAAERDFNIFHAV